MKIVEISDKYIEYLRKYFPNTTMDSKQHHRSHKRKYLGILFEIHGIPYYAPFSSPKKKDYNLDGTIRKSTLFIVRMTK